MTEKGIQNALRKWTDNHKYVLANSFIFHWESDFFSVTKTGTVYEFEIKCSKSDYKKDFEKEKHLFFDAALKSKTHLVTKSKYGGWYDGDLLFNYQSYELVIGFYHRGMKDKEHMSFTHEEDSFGYWMRHEGNISLWKKQERAHAACTKIVITQISDKLIPNRFYYVCPEGLIKVADLPSYAGLMYTDGTDCWMVKQAPMIHKRPLLKTNLPSILLDKFWFQSQEDRRTISRLNYHLEDQNKNDEQETTRAISADKIRNEGQDIQL